MGISLYDLIINPPSDPSGDLWGLDCEFIEMDQPEGWQSADKTPLQRDLLRRRGLARAAGQRCDYPNKMDFAVRVIRRAVRRLPPDSWYLAYSAGNDSTALSCILVMDLKLKIHHVMSNTRLEYPETIRNLHAHRRRLDGLGVPLTVAYPEKRPMEVWREDGIPLFSKQLASKYRQWVNTGNDAHLRQVPANLRGAFAALREKGIVLTEKCCDELKKKPIKLVAKQHGFLGAITGIRAEESEDRKMAFLQRGCLYNSARNKQWVCNPLIHWSAEDVQRCLEEHDIRLEQPGNGTGRSGCVNCGFGCHLDQRKGVPNSLQLLHDSNPVMWDKTMGEWGFREACEAAGIKVVPE